MVALHPNSNAVWGLLYLDVYSKQTHFTAKRPGPVTRARRLHQLASQAHLDVRRPRHSAGSNSAADWPPPLWVSALEGGGGQPLAYFAFVDSWVCVTTNDLVCSYLLEADWVWCVCFPVILVLFRSAHADKLADPGRAHQARISPCSIVTHFRCRGTRMTWLHVVGVGPG